MDQIYKQNQTAEGCGRKTIYFFRKRNKPKLKGLVYNEQLKKRILIKEECQI